MSQCSSCKYMAAPRGLVKYIEDADGMYVGESQSAHRTCTRILHGNGGDHEHMVDSEPALVVDGSGYAARLIVLPTFGCNLHEPK